LNKLKRLTAFIAGIVENMFSTAHCVGTRETCGDRLSESISVIMLYIKKGNIELASDSSRLKLFDGHQICEFHRIRVEGVSAFALREDQGL